MLPQGLPSVRELTGSLCVVVMEVCAICYIFLILLPWVGEQRYLTLYRKHGFLIHIQKEISSNCYIEGEIESGRNPSPPPSLLAERKLSLIFFSFGKELGNRMLLKYDNINMALLCLITLFWANILLHHKNCQQSL